MSIFSVGIGAVSSTTCRLTPTIGRSPLSTWRWCGRRTSRSRAAASPPRPRARCRPSRRSSGCRRSASACMLVGQRLDEVAAAERIGDRRHARFLGDDLLRAQRQRGRVLGRQRVGLVEAVGVQRLRAAQHRRQRLQRRAHHVVQRLLRHQRDARRLRVRAQHPGARVLGAEAVAHDARPHPARRAELRDLLEEVVVDVPEERQPRRELVDVEAGVDCPAGRSRCRRRA